MSDEKHINQTKLSFIQFLRYCGNMKEASYPRFKFDEKVVNDKTLYNCKAWLPANSVYNSEVQVS